VSVLGDASGVDESLVPADRRLGNRAEPHPADFDHKDKRARPMHQCDSSDMLGDRAGVRLAHRDPARRCDEAAGVVYRFARLTVDVPTMNMRTPSREEAVMTSRAMLVVGLLLASMVPSVSGQGLSSGSSGGLKLEGVRAPKSTYLDWNPRSATTYPKPQPTVDTGDRVSAKVSPDWDKKDSENQYVYSPNQYVAIEGKPSASGGRITLPDLQPPQLFRIVIDKKILKLVGNVTLHVVDDSIIPTPFDTTIQDLSEMIRNNPGDSKLYRARGIIEWQVRRFNDATADLDDAIRLCPKDALASYFRALVSYELGVENNAENRDNPDVHVNADQYLRAYSDFSEALRLDRIQSDPTLRLDSFTRPRAYLYRGRTCMRPPYFATAAEDFTTAIRLDPANVSIYLDRAKAYANLRNPNPASIADFEKVLKDSGKSPSVLLGEAAAYRVLQNRISAIKAFKEVIDDRDSSTGDQRMAAYLGRAEALESSYPTPKYDDALRDYAVVIESPSAKDWYWETYVDPKGAPVPCYEDIVYSSAKDSDRKSAYASRARIHYKRGELRLAIRDCTGYLALVGVLADDPNASIVFAARGDFRSQLAEDILSGKNDGLLSLFLGALFGPIGRIEGGLIEAGSLLDDAIKDYQSALNLDPKYTDALIGMAHVYILQESYAQAIDDLNAALRIDPTNAGATAQRVKAVAGKAEADAVAAKADADKNKKPADNRLADAQTAAALEETAARIETARSVAEAAKANAERAKLDAAKSIQARANQDTPLSIAGTQAALQEISARIEEARARIETARANAEIAKANAEKAKLEAARNFKARSELK
jgi:tetratricopeptide (TPR) repeat protein